MSSAPFIFRKLVRSLVNYWRGLGRRVVSFLDDGIGGSPDYASCLVHSRLCRSDLVSAGFFVNLQKSVWEPSQVGTWLGFHLDFSLNFITVLRPKITKLQESISRIFAQRFVYAKDLASVAGQLNLFLAIGNIVRLMSRAMYAQISAQNSWFSNFYLEDSVVKELVFWQSHLIISMAVVFGLSPVQLELFFRMLVTPDLAVTLLNLGPRWPRKAFGRLI